MKLFLCIDHTLVATYVKIHVYAIEHAVVAFGQVSGISTCRVKFTKILYAVKLLLLTAYIEVYLSAIEVLGTPFMRQ